MDNNTILYKICAKQRTATITLNKPSTCNALDLTMIKLFTSYVNRAANNTLVKIVIITANGKHFSSGADLAWMQQAINYSKQQNYQDVKWFAKMLLSLYNLNKPVICAIAGNVYAGAMGIIACADLVLAANNTKFCFPEVKLGLAPTVISPFVLKATNNSNFIKHKMLTAIPFSASEAKQHGLVHIVVAKYDLAKNLAQQVKILTDLPSEGIIATKKLWRRSGVKINLTNLDLNIKQLATLRTDPVARRLIHKFLKIAYSD